MDSSSGRSSVKASTFMTGGGSGKKGRTAPSAPTKIRGATLARPRSPVHPPRQLPLSTRLECSTHGKKKHHTGTSRLSVGRPTPRHGVWHHQPCPAPVTTTNGDALPSLWPERYWAIQRMNFTAFTFRQLHSFLELHASTSMTGGEARRGEARGALRRPLNHRHVRELRGHESSDAVLR
ncbi:hypothetical protein E2C01_003908 [Portunus trituberculatus]|uniref:Uncharacterized protein n=1 Tax=Portunus trituberculatus TaxID=210409 RepID=A0A5B7CSE7_PORTR|nr:hypothetical protein [Portunus trituberculatus]